MEQILIYATILAPIVAGLVQISKGYIGAEGKLIPLVALSIGITIGCLYGLTVAGDTVLYTWAGGIAGMTSVGVYELSKNNKSE